MRPSNGDGLDIAVDDGRIVGVRGRVTDRVNHGRLDPKDLFGWHQRRPQRTSDCSNLPNAAIPGRSAK